jgi:hypothetical protein
MSLTFYIIASSVVAHGGSITVDPTDHMRVSVEAGGMMRDVSTNEVLASDDYNNYDRLGLGSDGYSYNGYDAYTEYSYSAYDAYDSNLGGAKQSCSSCCDTAVGSDEYGHDYVDGLGATEANSSGFPALPTGCSEVLKTCYPDWDGTIWPPELKTWEDNKKGFVLCCKAGHYKDEMCDSIASAAFDSKLGMGFPDGLSKDFCNTINSLVKSHFKHKEDEKQEAANGSTAALAETHVSVLERFSKQVHGQVDRLRERSPALFGTLETPLTVQAVTALGASLATSAALLQRSDLAVMTTLAFFVSVAKGCGEALVKRGVKEGAERGVGQTAKKGLTEAADQGAKQSVKQGAKEGAAKVMADKELNSWFLMAAQDAQSSGTVAKAMAVMRQNEAKGMSHMDAIRHMFADLNPRRASEVGLGPTPSNAVKDMPAP